MANGKERYMVEFNAESIRRKMNAIDTQLARVVKLRDKYQAAIEELTTKREAFEIVLGELGIAISPATPVRSPNGAGGLIGRCVAEWPTDDLITIDRLKEVSDELEDVQNNTISRVLLKLVEDGVLRVEERGSGRRQSIYRKIGGEAHEMI